MGELVVDIHNRCTRVKCKCAGNKQILTAKAGSLSGIKGFGYCTHEVIGKAQISIVTWRTVELARKGFFRPFEGARSLTVYYHSRFDGKKNLIKKPLFIRVKYEGNKTYWFESLGSYDNKRWRRLDQSELNGFPGDDSYADKAEFEERLKEVACRLFLFHIIRIDLYQKNSYLCPICTRHINVEFRQESHPVISGYKRYSYEGFTNNFVLVHKGTQLTYRKRSLITGLGYFLPIRVEKDYIDKVSVYYWDGDVDHSKPLLLQIITTGDVSYWFENFGKPGGKYDKWKAIGNAESNGFNYYGYQLKERLDVLNCIYNEVVQIDIGKQVCHNSKHYLHRNRMTYTCGEEYGTYPVIHAYRYQPSRSFSRGVFDISDVTVNGQHQKFQDNPLPLQGVTRLMAYISPCDKEKPFLICVEYGKSVNTRENNTYKWYYRKSKGDEWEVYPEFTSIQSPRHVKTKLGDILDGLRDTLGLQECNVITEAEGIQIDVSKTVDPGYFTTYYYESTVTQKKYSMFLNKTERYPLFGFFMNTHRANTTSKTFTLGKFLQGKGYIVAGKKTPGVENVQVYFWQGSPNIPILLGIKQQNKDPKYYGKLVSGDTWGDDQVNKMDKQQALDHQNCQINGAIPIELTNPEDLQGFQSKDKQSSCMRYKFVRKSVQPQLPLGAAETYTGIGYQIPDKTKISRVTYGLNPTNITPPYQEEKPLLHIYRWKNSGIPLLVEFITTPNESDWFENINRDSLSWKHIHKIEADGFYTTGDSNPKLTENFTKKINEVNCRVHSVVQLDISLQTGSYCHSHSGRIKVTKEQLSAYSGFIGYSHEPTTEDNTFIVSSIFYGIHRQDTGKLTLPIRNVSKVTVYFPECNTTIPLLIHIKYDKEKETWLKKTNDYHNWEDVTNEIPGVRTNEKIRNILEQVKGETNACTKPKTLPILRHSRVTSSDTGNANDPAFGPGQQISDQNNGDKLDSLNDIFNDTDILYQESLEFFGPDDEEEDTRIKNEQATHTFVSDSQSSIMAQLLKHNPYLSGTSIISLSQAAFTTPKVIIDIKKSPDKEYTYTVSNIGEVFLQKDEDPYGSGFNRFLHVSNEDIPFEVEKVEYNGDGKRDIKPNGLIESYSVWYWKNDNGMINPLLVEIEKSDNTYEYHYNKGGNEWTELQENTLPPFKDEPLETQLDGLNCYLNQAVTMDLSESRKNGGPYCCSYHERTSLKKVSVTSGSVNAPGSGTTRSIPYYKHEISGGTKLSKIKYYIGDDTVGSKRKSIKIPGLKSSANDSVKIYVFYCSKDNPVLIYLDSSQHVKGWYRKDKSSDEKPWIKVLDNLSTKTPDNIKSCNDEFNELVSILNSFGCDNYQKCSDNSDAKIQVQAQTDSGVTVELRQKSGNYSGSPSGKNKINVAASEGPKNFDKYIHTITTSSKLAEIKDDQDSTIKGPTGNNVSLVAAYYWKHGTSKNPLLIEVEDNGNYTYYANSKTDPWKVYDTKKSGQLDQAELEKKLTLLNCEMNNVVQIDVNRTEGLYCHEPGDSQSLHKDKKVKVTETGQGQLGKYTAYSHTPTNGGGTFNISELKKGDNVTLTGIRTPVKNASEVVVYMCPKNGNTPLLIYVKEGGGTKKWFKILDCDSSVSTWERTYSLNDKKDTDHSSIVNFLDELNSTCKPPAITIDIYERSGTGKHTIYGGNSSNVYITPNSSIAEFTDSTYKVHGRNYFTLQGINYSNKPTSGIIYNGSCISKVTSVSVFYWSHLENDSRKGPPDDRGKPLLVKITTQDHIGKNKVDSYYENTDPKENLSWKRATGDLPDQLEKKLKLLNCRFNNAIVIDINQKSTPGHYDACETTARTSMDPNHATDKMKVDQDPGDTGKLLNYKVYKHTLNGNGKFHVTEFINNGATSRETLNGISPLPILDVTEVKVYICEKDERPLLLYYRNGGNHHWYKNKDTGNSNTGEWEKETSELSTSDDTNQYEKILDVLNGLDSSCRSDTPQASALGLELATGSALAGYVSSGVFAGAGGLTGLGWWAFKRTKGDPWVRQI
ncbi:hypothetical protein BEWA_044500 [Theileria equi strain WA]|uniref:EF-hand domain-containing protein n=1 Tax=Theileria equi strain WA TaxID=1537102 RepID=L1LBF7_THEEQ|nr:hypothetical protein BEWA_044500 [Theileria equi strain WA]EKX72609.1 hypothetical protein BEWA_044500 [Theileria equi strain WA]|eukprot:XP_004832061.1 hypothetical protein BEWA_044500 [Theileria equi strain WA]